VQDHKQHAYVVSDLHLGSSETQYQAFLEFLKRLPAEAALILNGDIVNDPTRHQVCEAEKETVLERLCNESLHRRVIWIGGNNDADYRPDASGEIEFRDHIILGKDIYICHGHQFLQLSGCTACLQKILRCVYGRITGRSGRTPHTAAYLQRIPPLYRMVCRLLAHNASRFARQHGCRTIICGHTHYAEEHTINSIRYLNAGAWTEPQAHSVLITDKTMTLAEVIP
jgi:UDP-2,3-diacylglucosamine pyrophosphatase LpxH